MTEEITIDEFRRVDLRAARVIDCSRVEKSRNLLQIQVDLGDEKRQIISSISSFYEPQELIGKTIIIIANLKKAVFMGLESQGMLLSVENDDRLSLLTIDREMEPGLRVS